MTQPKAHSWIDGLAPYKAGKATLDGVENPVKLSANESPLGPSPRAIEAFRAAASHLHRYPDPASGDLTAVLAEVHDLDAEKIFCAAGSDEILTLLIHTYAGEGDEIICSTYGFSVYPIQAQAVGAVAVKVPNKNWAADVDAMLAAVTAKTKLVFIDNPNNPTGAYLPWSEVERLHAGLPSHVILVLDAAYGECADAPDYQAGEALVDRSDNVVMTRTLSKLYGLAALRVGWGYGPKALLDPMHRVRMPFNVNTPAQKAAVAAIRDQDYLRGVVAFNKQGREAMTADLLAMGLDVVPSQTNFVLVGFPDEADEDGRPMAQQVYDFLAQSGYIVRYLPAQGLPNHLRLTIGSESENHSLLALIQEFMQTQNYGNQHDTD